MSTVPAAGVLLMSKRDIGQRSLKEGDLVVVSTVADDHVREVHDLRVTPYDIPVGCVAAYYPECNPLIPLWHHARKSEVPAAKAIPVRIRKQAESAQE
jgi:anaerobic selenocysteine-containing dehydrogenase